MITWQINIETHSGYVAPSLASNCMAVFWHVLLLYKISRGQLSDGRKEFKKNPRMCVRRRHICTFLRIDMWRTSQGPG